MKLLNWNVAWRGLGTSPKGPELKRRIIGAGADVICLTESSTDRGLSGGHWIHADEDYGYKITPGRRKVSLWSRGKWETFSSIGSKKLPSGRFVFGMTTVENQSWRIMGVCIPWSHAHVATGQKNKKVWQVHEDYLATLKPVLRRLKPDVIVGDFNQRLPRDREPHRVADALTDTLAGYDIVTTGFHPKLIDHVAVDPGLRVNNITLIDKESSLGQLTDHLGVVVEVSST